MKLCILDDSYEQSNWVTKEFDLPSDPRRYLDEHECELHFSTKQRPSNRWNGFRKHNFDLFINLCDGAWDENHPGVGGAGVGAAGAPFYRRNRRLFKSPSR